MSGDSSDKIGKFVYGGIILNAAKSERSVNPMEDTL